MAIHAEEEGERREERRGEEGGGRSSDRMTCRVIGASDSCEMHRRWSSDAGDDGSDAVKRGVTERSKVTRSEAVATIWVGDESDDDCDAASRKVEISLDCMASASIQHYALVTKHSTGVGVEEGRVLGEI